MTGSVAGGQRPTITLPDEDPNASLVYSSPPCFMHELDRSFLGYLSDAEVAALLQDLLAARWPDTITVSASVRTMLGRHLACVVATMPGNGPVSPPAMERYVPLGDDLQQLTDRLREALPRLHDHALRQDLNQLLGMLERDVAPIMECWEEVRRWRKAQRQRLIADRLATTPEERHRRDALVEAQLRTCLPASGASQLIGFYWPFKGEYDPRPVMRALHGQGRRLALPVIAEQARPLVFREWWPGKRMVPGVWNIPVPAEGETVLPDTLVAPLVGFDGLGYRLGYGGGYYDRTLAAMADRPLTIGVGFDLSRLETIYPQPHDIPMHLIVTEHGVSSLPDKSPAAARAQAAAERGNQ